MEVKLRWPAPHVSTLLEQLGPSQRDHVEPVAARPLEQVLDEVEQARVGPLQVLEDEHGRIRVRQALEEKAPGREELLPVGRVFALAGPEQLRERGLDEAALLLVQEMLAQRRPELLERDRGLVVLGDLTAHAHHVR